MGIRDADKNGKDQLDWNKEIMIQISIHFLREKVQKFVRLLILFDEFNLSNELLVNRDEAGTFIAVENKTIDCTQEVDVHLNGVSSKVNTLNARMDVLKH